MSAEARLFKRALDGDIKEMMKEGFDPSFLTYPYDVTGQMLIDFYRKHKELPTLERFQIICEEHGEIPIADEAPERWSIYWEYLLKEANEARTAKTLNKMARLFNEEAMPTADFLKHSISELQKISDGFAGGGALVRAPECGDEALEEYELGENGLLPGIPIDPDLRFLTQSLNVLEPRHITTILARTKVGKTWLALILAHFAAKHGYQVLFASMEMGRQDIYRRLIAIATKTNYDAIKNTYLKGAPKELVMAVFRNQIKEYDYLKNIAIMRPAEITGAMSIENRAHSMDASLVIADAVYLLPGDGEKEYERIKHNLTIIRRASLETGRHWVLTAQLNKRARGIKSANEFATAGSDSLNQDSNNIIFLVRRGIDEKNHTIVCSLGRGRDCADQTPYLNNWDFINMDYSTIKKHRGTTGGGPSVDERIKAI